MIAKLALAAMMVLVVVMAAVPASTAISENDVSSVTNTIQSAFISTLQAERSGGNVTSLVAALNTAVQLVEKAQAENSTNPAQASSDLQEAQEFALYANAGSAEVSFVGSSLRQSIFVRSVVSAAAILVAAVLVYVYSGLVFRWLWVRLYRGYVVRPANG